MVYCIDEVKEETREKTSVVWEMNKWPMGMTSSFFSEYPQVRLFNNWIFTRRQDMSHADKDDWVKSSLFGTNQVESLIIHVLVSHVYA